MRGVLDGALRVIGAMDHRVQCHWSPRGGLRADRHWEPGRRTHHWILHPLTTPPLPCSPSKTKLEKNSLATFETSLSLISRDRSSFSLGKYFFPFLRGRIFLKLSERPQNFLDIKYLLENKQRFDKLSINESETCGFDFP